jgi:hypothetical protein
VIKDKQFCMSCLIEILSSGSSISVFSHYLNWNVVKAFVPLLLTPTSTTDISDGVSLRLYVRPHQNSQFLISVGEEFFEFKDHS